MKRRNDLTPPLDEWTILLALLGRDPARGKFLRQLAMTHPDAGHIEKLWDEHREFLISEAERRGIPRERYARWIDPPESWQPHGSDTDPAA